MSAEFVPVTEGDAPAVVAFLSTHAWPFHTGGTPTPEFLQERIDAGWLAAAGSETYWVGAGGARAGLLRLFDLDDGTPLFDLRLAPEFRGQGIGGETVRWLTAETFSKHGDVDRIEATTRADNIPMRRALLSAGWVKESHWRNSWPDSQGRTHDSVGYGILRADHESGTRTPVDWDDEPVSTAVG